MAEDRSYYDILGVEKNATDQQLKTAWRNLSRMWHPDKQKTEEDKRKGEEKIKEINEAYAVLSDEEKRKIYDKFGKEGLNGGGMDPSGFDFADFIFGSHFRKQEKHVDFIKIKVPIKLEDSYKGTTIVKEYTKYKKCESCDGTGNKDKQEHKCSECKGNGVITQAINMGGYATRVQTTCNKCEGSGLSKDCKQCKVCDGDGSMKCKTNLTITIPKGIANGTTLVHRGIGHEVDSIVGDVHVAITIQPHETFKQHFETKELQMDQHDLFMTCKITLAESLTRLSKTFEHLDKRFLTIIEEGPIRHGTIKQIPKEGMPINDTSSKGNLYIFFDVEYPKSLSFDAKDSIYTALCNKSLKDVDFSVPKNSTLIKTTNFNTTNKQNTKKNSHHHQQQAQCTHQ